MTRYDYFLIWMYNNSLFVLIWMHWFADFVCQTSYMALGKSKSNKPLLLHIAVYTLPFLFWGVRFALINGITHLIIDYWTSRFNSKMWDTKNYRMFWIGIGFDQALHMTVLLYTAKYLLLAF